MVIVTIIIEPQWSGAEVDVPDEVVNQSDLLHALKHRANVRSTYAFARGILKRDKEEQQLTEDDSSPSSGSGGESSSPKQRLRLKTVMSAVVQGTKVSSMTTKMTDVFRGAGVERELQAKLSALTMSVLKDQQWPLFLARLEELRREVGVLQFVNDLNPNAVKVGRQIEDSVHAVREQLEATDLVHTCIADLQTHMTAENLWNKLMQAQDLINSAETRANNLKKKLQSICMVKLRQQVRDDSSSHDSMGDTGHSFPSSTNTPHHTGFHGSSQSWMHVEEEISHEQE
eukprot:CAMPEP_0180695088 /NCGR_PEP_ID=MMETSP1038_2-20121128/2259_1 /TAXON_ID=632150 /ORGANISM="Azadinium spinosum, Strain 3D9" /LENGTH=285 /DNA_ID=CAMNT_0022726477 /DNA_START=21 /DNA_END=875 /DNA_ORIENTATION=-